MFCQLAVYHHHHHHHQSLPRFPPCSSVGIRCARDSAAISASPSSARERRKERNERRMQQKVSWREELEERQMETKKKKAPSKGLSYELDMTRLTAQGMQWWMLLVSIRSELSVAEDITSALSREFPDEKFEVFVPSVPTKRIMKDGSISPATRRLHSGCVFLRCVLKRGIHDAVKRIPRVRGFFGKRIGFYDYVIMPTPVPVEDIEGMQKKIREEELDLQRLKELAKEERKKEQADIEEATSEKDSTLTVGSYIRVLNGPYANFEGRIVNLPDANKQVETSLMAFGEIHKVMLPLNDIEILSTAA